MSPDSNLQATATQPDTSSQSHVASHIKSLDGLVEVIVGPQKQVFPLHKEILCAVSSYFRSALEGSFLEGLTQKIELPEDDVTVLKYFRVWLYSLIVQEYLPSVSQAKGESESEVESKPNTDIDWKILLDLYWRMHKAIESLAPKIK